MNPMYGHLEVAGHVLGTAGFLHPGLSPTGFEAGQSLPLFTRSAGFSPETEAFLSRIRESGQIQRGEITGDVAQILTQLGTTMAEFQRNITTSTTAFPV